MLTGHKKDTELNQWASIQDYNLIIKPWKNLLFSYVLKGSYISVYEKFQDLLKDLTKKMSEESYRRAAGFDWQIILDKYRCLYSEFSAWEFAFLPLFFFPESAG